MGAKFSIELVGPSLPAFGREIAKSGKRVTQATRDDAPKQAKASLLASVRGYRKSGELERSVVTFNRRSGSGAGFTAPYAAKLDSGGTTQARLQARMTIPIAGWSQPPRSSGKLALIPTGKGGVLARVSGDAVRPLFALRQTVTQRARPFLKRAGGMTAERSEVGTERNAGREMDRAIAVAKKRGSRR